MEMFLPMAKYVPATRSPAVFSIRCGQAHYERCSEQSLLFMVHTGDPPEDRASGGVGGHQSND